jgi:hypothetical protein
MIRILLICSTVELKNDEIKLMCKPLIINGYPEHLINIGKREAEAITKRMISLQQQTQKLQQKKKGYFLLCYYDQESTLFAYKIKRLCRKLLPVMQINICFRKTFTVKSIFLHLQKGKDELKKEKKLVYKITFLNCNKCYIGKTNRKKETRMKEHKADIRKQTKSSNVAQHANEQKHSFDFTHSETPALETNWQRRVIKESLVTHKMQDKSLNDVKFILNIFN